MKTKSVKVGNWKVCCNDMMGMLINDFICATDISVEDFYLFVNVSESPTINFCPYCGVKIPKLKRFED